MPDIFPFRMMASVAGGYDFPCDPDTPSDQQSLFWIPSLQPQAVSLTIVPQAIDADAVTPIALTQLDGLDLRQSDDGWHGVIDDEFGANPPA